MKHSADFPVDSIGGLPDAPLAMPKQVLERKSSLYATLRALIAGTFARY